MWDEGDSKDFVDYGRYFVPGRERQIAVIAGMIPAADEPFRVVELCCGEGALAEVILDTYPACSLLGLDGSETMRRAARERLARFGERFQALGFDLGAIDWSVLSGPVQAVVSSLCIHHLAGPGKQSLFAQVYEVLAPGGAFVVADLIQPAGERGDEGAVFDAFRRLKWNNFRTPDPFDRPSDLLEQLKWLEAAGFVEVDVYWLEAGHAIFGGRRR